MKSQGPSGIGFIGFRTDRFDEMVALFRDRIGLATIREAAWCHFRASDGTVMEIIGPGRPDRRRA